jgi:hypothetical protein
VLGAKLAAFYVSENKGARSAKELYYLDGTQKALDKFGKKVNPAEIHAIPMSESFESLPASGASSTDSFSRWTEPISNLFKKIHL